MIQSNYWIYAQAVVAAAADPVSHLEFSMSQHCHLGEAVPTLHQVNHVEHCQEGQGDVDVATVARALLMQDVGIGR